MKNKKKLIIIVAFIIETVVLVISLTYSGVVFLVNDAKTEWFDEKSPNGKYHVKCYKVGTPMFFSSQKLLIYFDTTGLPYVEGTNPISFRTELANDGANLHKDNYSIEWLSDSVKIVFRGEESGGDNIYQIPYYRTNSENNNKEKTANVEYNFNCGEVFEITNNTIYYGDIKEDKAKYLSENLSGDFKVINYENEELININDITVGDYITTYEPTEKYQNAKTIIVVAKKDYNLEQVKKELLNKREFDAELAYYNEKENYIIAKVALDSKTFDTVNSQPFYFMKLLIGKNTETYLGNKENNANSNYGYHVNELCKIELVSNIAYLPNIYMVKSIEFIAD